MGYLVMGVRLRVGMTMMLIDDDRAKSESEVDEHQG